MFAKGVSRFSRVSKGDVEVQWCKSKQVRRRENKHNLMIEMGIPFG